MGRAWWDADTMRWRQFFLTSWMILQNEKYGKIKVDEVFKKLADVKELRNVEIMTLH